MTTSSSTCVTTASASTQAPWKRCSTASRTERPTLPPGIARATASVWHSCERSRTRTEGTLPSRRRLAVEPLSRSPSPPHRSGQCHEELLQLGFGHRVLAIGPGAGDAFSEPRGDDLESGSVQGARHRGELGDHVLAVAALLDHRDHAVQLSLGASQSIQHCGDAVLIPNHGRPFVSVAIATHSPPGYMPRPKTSSACDGCLLSMDEPVEGAV